MPRKTFELAPAGARPGRFNEAAARCRGKRTREQTRVYRPRRASMRPRPDAAENRDTRMLAGVISDVASMRPRPDAAENVRSTFRDGRVR